MSLNSLSELVSVTDSAVKSLNNNVSENTMKNAGSPFDSPRSIVSHSDSGIEKTQSKSGGTFPRGIESKTKNSIARNGKSEKNVSDTNTDSNDTVTGKDAVISSRLEIEPHNKSVNKMNTSIDSGRSQGSGKYSNASTQSSRGKLSNKDNKQLKNVRVQRHCDDVNSMNANQNVRKYSINASIGKDSSCCNDDDHPQIIDVVSRDFETHNRTSENDSSQDIVNNSSEGSNSMDSCASGHKSFGKTLSAHCQSLKQGDLNKGVLDPTKARVFDDVYISQFQLTEKQRDLKGALAKRSENNQPRRKQVQPKIIEHKRVKNEESCSNHLDTVSNVSSDAPGNAVTSTTDSVMTAAVAASAAVAATQPFLKIQQDLESQIKQLVTQLAEIQQDKSPATLELSANSHKKTDGNRILHLEQQVAELNERRLEHIESLQQQQLQMQAQLLMMSRSKSPRTELYLTKRQKSPSRGTNNGSQIPRPITVLRDNKPAPTNGYTAHSYDSALGQSQSSFFNPNTLSKHHNYLSEVRELQGSLLDTPAPRKHIPQPTPYTLPEEQHGHMGFLQELLDKNGTPTHDTTFSVAPGYEQNRNNSSKMGYGRRDKSPVDQARRLMSSLSNLEMETADSIWGAKENLAHKVDIHRGPAPLDQYLKYPETKSSPYPTLSDVKKKRQDRPNLDDILEAKKVLRQLETTRETLDKNIEQVVRTSRDMHVFSALLTNAADGGASDHTRIERMVRKKIASLSEDVQREVLRGLAEEETKKAAAEAELIRLKNAMKKNPGRFETTKSRPAKQFSDYSTKLTSKGLHIPPSTTYSSKTARPTTSKVKQPPKPTAIKDEKTMTRTYGKPEYQRGRTTIRDPYMHFQNAKKGKPAVMNESMVSRDGRSKSPMGKRQQSPMRDNQLPRQFYFSPTRGYFPVNANNTGPIPGEMVPMAIPLGQPRLEPGVRASAKPVMAASGNPITSTPVPVTAETKNAAVISFLMQQEQKQAEGREPELTKQVLPPIDIDSISPSSSRITDIQIRSPQHGNQNVTFLQETHGKDWFMRKIEAADEGRIARMLTPAEQDSDLNKSITEEDYSADEQEGEGIVFPGHDPKTPEYTGPDFPPQRSRQGQIVGDNPAEEAPLVSDVMAEDMRRRDMLEDNAVNWLEQELMARVLTEVMPLQVHQNAADISEAQNDHSEASDKEESLLVADMIGQGGLQLFIDAGQPVDNRLVNALVGEVIREKVNAMLAHKELDPSQPRPLVNGRELEDDAVLDEDDRKVRSNLPRVPTPDPTPKTSPIASPRRATTNPPYAQAPVTPPHSPPADGFTFKKRPGADLQEQSPRAIEEPEQVRVMATPAAAAQIPAVPLEPVTANLPAMEPESDSDITVSVDISEELRRVSAQGKKPEQPSLPVQMCHDVSTPPISPLPVEEEEEQNKPYFSYKQTTPPASPPPAQPEPLIIAPSSPQKQKKVEQPIQEEESFEEEEEEQEEEERYIEPKKILTSVAVGDDSPMTTMRRTLEQPRSPSPKREIRSHSPTTDTMMSEESSISESVNENVSEGQWLLSRSEGQIVGIPGKVGIHDLKKGYQQMVDLSTASTLHDTEDLDLDTFGTKSEGEVLVRGLPAPDQDPMLELMVQMQKNPRLAGIRDIPDSHIEQMVGQSAARNNLGRSVGEMSVGQVAPSRIIKVQSRQNGNGQRRGRGSPVFSPSSSLDRSAADDYSFEERNGKRDREGHHHRHNQRRSPTPPHHRQHQEQPRSQGRNRSPDYGSRPRSPEHRRQHSPVNKTDPRNRNRKQMQYQPVLSQGAPMSTRRQQPQSGHRRSSDNYQRSRSADGGMRHSRESAASEPYTSNAYSVDQTSQSLESAAFRRSGDGVLTSSLKSRQSGVKKSVEFDLTGTYEQQRRETTRSSLTASRDSNRSADSNRLSEQSRSLGINYSYSIDDSFDDSELKRIVGGTSTGTHTGPYRMSVTIPSTYGDDSDISDYNE